MRFSTSTLLALPLLAAAAQQKSPLDEAMGQLQTIFEKVAAFLPNIPNPNKQHPVDAANAATASAGGKTLHVLTLDSWKETVRSPVKAESTTPEEWFILVTGGNKTCFGHCGTVETAFNKSALLLAANPTAPHLGYLNCEDQPVLCNSWGAGPPALWVMEIKPEPAPVDIRIVGLNTTSTTAKTFTDLHALKTWKESPLYEGYFHPFDGPLAEYNLNVPLGYIFWVFAIVPSWMFMIAISFLSRSIMGNRMAPQPNRRPGAPAAAQVRALPSNDRA
ncbi:hypothetical protein BP6252_03337 [Coleophoma cylindrospora]|uniref:Peptidyl-tRNA hydrolase n=1 Tax=Coleophoma cylindrospora TaxID=1849047 RepID=A0A3D8S7E0_9HELO|nr:hypothetical protein BP6252_03337 [Coleophoma cylindrospora]